MSIQQHQRATAPSSACGVSCCSGQHRALSPCCRNGLACCMYCLYCLCQRTAAEHEGQAPQRPSCCTGASSFKLDFSSSTRQYLTYGTHQELSVHCPHLWLPTFCKARQHQFDVPSLSRQCVCMACWLCPFSCCMACVSQLAPLLHLMPCATSLATRTTPTLILSSSWGRCACITPLLTCGGCVCAGLLLHSPGRNTDSVSLKPLNTRYSRISSLISRV